MAKVIYSTLWEHPLGTSGMALSAEKFPAVDLSGNSHTVPVGQLYSKSFAAGDINYCELPGGHWYYENLKTKARGFLLNKYLPPLFVEVIKQLKASTINPKDLSIGEALERLDNSLHWVNLDNSLVTLKMLFSEIFSKENPAMNKQAPPQPKKYKWQLSYRGIE